MYISHTQAKYGWANEACRCRGFHQVQHFCHKTIKIVPFSILSNIFQVLPPLNHHPFPFFHTLLRRQLAILHATMPSLGRLSRPATQQRLAALVNSRVAFFRYITQVNLNGVNNTSNSPHRGSAFSTLLTGEGADYVLPPWKLPISVINGSRNRLLVLIIPLASSFFLTS